MEYDLRPLVHLEDFKNDTENLKEGNPLENSKLLSNYLNENFSDEEIASLKIPKYFYEIVFDKPGGLVMPIIVEYEYEDGTKERIKYPVQVWRKNDNEVSKLVTSEKKIINITLDPDLETADIDTSNNSWPKKQDDSEFDKFKNKMIKLMVLNNRPLLYFYLLVVLKFYLLVLLFYCFWSR